MILMKKIMMSLGMALAGLTGFKATTLNDKAAAAEPTSIAKVKKKKSNPRFNNNGKQLDLSDDGGNQIDLSSDLGFYKAILKKLGVRETPEKIKFLQAWRQGEGGLARNNPFNTSKHVPGTLDTKYNSHGVRNYPDRQTGLEATVATLKLSHYKEIVDLLKDDTVTAHDLAYTSALKKWGTGDMVKKVLASGHVDPPDIVA
jgi:hypothetical protein